MEKRFKNIYMLFIWRIKRWKENSFDFTFVYLQLTIRGKLLYMYSFNRRLFATAFEKHRALKIYICTQYRNSLRVKAFSVTVIDVISTFYPHWSRKKIKYINHIYIDIPKCIFEIKRIENFCMRQFMKISKNTEGPFYVKNISCCMKKCYKLDF